MKAREYRAVRRMWRGTSCAARSLGRVAAGRGLAVNEEGRLRAAARVIEIWTRCWIGNRSTRGAKARARPKLQGTIRRQWQGLRCVARSTTRCLLGHGRAAREDGRLRSARSALAAWASTWLRGSRGETPTPRNGTAWRDGHGEASRVLGRGVLLDQRAETAEATGHGSREDG